MIDHTSNVAAPAGRSEAMKLLPIMAAVFMAYLVIGVAMPVLPLHVHQGLGFDSFVVGLVAGSQFAASLFSRMWAGHHTDHKGSKHAVIVGLLVAVASGLLYLVSLWFVATPRLSVGILLLGRAVLGVSESFVMTGALSWGVGLLGTQRTGRAMSWIGTALYAALAASAPVGTALYAKYGFGAIAVVAAVIPLLALPVVRPLPATAPTARQPGGLGKVAGAIWMPGLGLALSGVGFGATTTFVSLLYAARNWDAAWLAFTALSIAFMLGRTLFGHLPDTFGGAKVALVCFLIEALGQSLVWLAPGAALALIGVTLTGLGYSLVYPALGVEAIRRAPPEARGLAMGTFTVFFDITMGLGTPILGGIANWAGLQAVFFVSALAALCSAPIAWWLMVTPARQWRSEHA